VQNAGAPTVSPGIIVRGSVDRSNLLGTPWELAQAWVGSELTLINDEGHGGGAAMTEALITATDRFAPRP
jgi:proline iminopeptidase